MTTHRVETADGHGLHVVDDGPTDGAAVVLVHGWPDTHEVWRYQVPTLVDAGHRVVVYDQRGFGRSDHLTNPADCHVFKAMVDVGTVLDALGIEQAHLVGHDWGSAPCWLAATFAPERVKSLTTLSVGHPLAFRSAGLEQRQKSFYMLLFQFPDIAEEWLRQNDWENMLSLIGDLENWPMRQRELEVPGALTSSLNWYRANMAPETLVEPPAELPPVQRPVLGIMGGQDWALLDTQMKNSANYVDADFRYLEIDEAAHWIQTDTPETLNRALLDWFSTHA